MTNSAPVRIALIGMGRMGQAIDALAADRNCEVVARIERENAGGGITIETLNGAETAIEFSSPDSAIANAVACLRLKCPVVIGTTGWSARLSELEAAVTNQQCAALWAPNFSVGVQLFLSVIEQAARKFVGASGFDAHVIETHHAAKKDAPSGTALAIQRRINDGGLEDIPITSVRVGSVPGTHEIIFDAPFEQIRLTHEARDRRVFADGALTAARWLRGAATVGLYTMRDVLDI